MPERVGFRDSRSQTVLVVLAACGLTVAMVALTASMALTSYRATLDAARQNARFVSSLVAGQMGMALLDMEDSLAELGRLLDNSPDRYIGDHNVRLRKLLAALQAERPYIRELLLTDPLGRVTDWSSETLPPDVSARDYIRAQQTGVGGAFVGMPVSSLRDPKDWVFGFSLGLRDDDGRLERIAVAVLDLDAMLEIFRDLDLPEGAGVAVMDLRGRVYLYAPGQERHVGRTAPGMEAYLRHGAQGGTIVGRSPLDSVEVVAGSTLVTRYPLLAFAGFRLEQVLAPWRRQALVYGGASLALVLVAGFLSVLLVRGQVRLSRQGRELALLASTDPLTGALNRRAFMNAAQREFARVRRYGGELSCVMLDLDHFKVVNDTYGHAAGDLALSAVAGLIRSRLRTPDLFCRWGGEEFLVLLPGTDQDGAAVLAEDLRVGLARLELEAEGVCFRLTGSFGVTVSLAEDASVEELLNRADRALYQAKDQGRDCVCRADLPENWKHPA